MSNCDSSNGECSHTGPGHFACQCATGYTSQDNGRTCVDVDECDSSPCESGAACTEGRFQETEYSCSCTPGWGGHNCGDDIDECASRPCGVSECTNLQAAFRCLCAAGFGGVHCHHEDPCISSPCQNSGQCTGGVGEYACTCSVGWTGHNCSNPQRDKCQDAQQYYDKIGIDGDTIARSPSGALVPNYERTEITLVNFSVPLNCEQLDITAALSAGRGNVTIVQPRESNDWTVQIDIVDNTEIEDFYDISVGLSCKADPLRLLIDGDPVVTTSGLQFDGDDSIAVPDLRDYAVDATFSISRKFGTVQKDSPDCSSDPNGVQFG